MIVLSALISCKQETENTIKQPVAIPKTELLADNKGFGWQKYVLLFKEKPFSGYVLENWKLSNWSKIFGN